MGSEGSLGWGFHVSRAASGSILLASAVLHIFLGPFCWLLFEHWSTKYGNTVLHLFYFMIQFLSRSLDAGFHVSSSETLSLLSTFPTNFLPILKFRGRAWERPWPGASCSFCSLLPWAPWWRKRRDSNLSGRVGEWGGCLLSVSTEVLKCELLASFI